MDETQPPTSRVWDINAGAQRAASAYRVVSAQPNWVVRVAMLTFFVIVAVPILFLLFLAMIAAVCVFAVGFAIHWVVSKFKPTLPANDGRENVRVIRRVE